MDEKVKCPPADHTYSDSQEDHQSGQLELADLLRETQQTSHVLRDRLNDALLTQEDESSKS